MVIFTFYSMLQYKKTSFYILYKNRYTKKASIVYYKAHVYSTLALTFVSYKNKKRELSTKKQEFLLFLIVEKIYMGGNS